MSVATTVQLFDKQFVLGAAVIGAAYATVIAVLGLILGKEAAGVAGVALSAVATGIFRQFETLRFRRVIESEHLEIEVPGISWWRILVAATSLFGQQILVGFGVAAVSIAIEFDVMTWMAETPDTQFMLITGVATAFMFFAGGFVLAKAFPIRSYSNLAIAAFLTCVLGDMLGFALLAALTSVQEAIADRVNNSWVYTIWIIYLVMVVVGARAATRRSSVKGEPATASEKATVS